MVLGLEVRGDLRATGRLGYDATIRKVHALEE